MFVPSMTKTFSSSLMAYADGSQNDGEMITWYGHIRKILSSYDATPPCAEEDISSTSQDYIFNENFPLITGGSCNCHTWYEKQHCLCTGVLDYLLGLKSRPGKSIGFNVWFGTTRNTTAKTHSAYVNFNSGYDERVSYTYPTFRLSDGYLSYGDISVHLDHTTSTIGTCADDGELGGRVYGKGYCYSQWLEGIPFRVPYQYTVSGYLYADSVSSSYDGSQREPSIQTFLGLLNGRGYEVVQREGSTEYYDVSYTQQSTANVTVKFIPDEA